MVCYLILLTTRTKFIIDIKVTERRITRANLLLIELLKKESLLKKKLPELDLLLKEKKST